MTLIAPWPPAESAVWGRPAAGALARRVHPDNGPAGRPLTGFGAPSRRPSIVSRAQAVKLLQKCKREGNASWATKVAA
jgi:hypothetical protein